MRVLVQGPGAVGRLLATRLAGGGVDVTLVDHDLRRAMEISKDGIPVTELDGSVKRVPVPACVADDLTPHWDLLIVCVKAFDTSLAVRSGSLGLVESGAVLVLSNGLGNVEQAGEYWPEERCFAGTMICGVLRDESPGSDDVCSGGIGSQGIRITGMGPVKVGYRGAVSGDRDVQRDAIVAVLREGGFDALPAQDIDAALWHKVAINCAVNPVAAMLEFENGMLLDTPAFGAAVSAAREVALVARAHGVDLPTDGWARAVSAVCEATSENRCSMLEDLRSGRRTEIDALNGRVVELGRERGIDVGVNRTLTRLIKALEQQRALSSAPALASS